MKKDSTIHHYFRFQKYTSSDLFEILQSLIKTKKLKPLGIPGDKLPDKDWLCNAILYIDPQDTYELCKSKREEQFKYTIEVNEEYFL